MPRTKLTKQAINAIKPDPAGRQVLYWDSDMSGFGLLVSGKKGSKSFVVQREVNGRSRRVTLGTVAEYWAGKASMEQIRADASDLLMRMRQGHDPKVHRSRAANATLREMLDSYCEGGSTGMREPVERSLKDWLDRPLREITPEMVEKRYRAIKRDIAQRAGRGEARAWTQTSQPGTATARLAMACLKAVWNHATGLPVPELPENPVKSERVRRAMKNDKPSARRRHVSWDKLPDFYAALDAYSAVSRTMADYLKLLLFTGMRRGEAASLQWADLDFTRRLIAIPGQRTKTKRKLDLPISDYVFDLLAERRRLGFENEYVFPAQSKSGHIAEPNIALREIAKQAGLGQLSPHDLRRTFKTVANRCGISAMDSAALINHSVGGNVDSDYDQVDGAGLAESMQKVADRMMELCGLVCWLPADRLRVQMPRVAYGGNVVPLPGVRSA